jgi:U3 small nucleolar RNA-associated protein 25
MQEDNPSDEALSDSDEDEQQSGKPYNELLELLHAKPEADGPSRKKRKTSHRDQDKSEAGQDGGDMIADGEEEALDADLQQQEPDEGDLEEGEDVVQDSDDEENGLSLSLIL